MLCIDILYIIDDVVLQKCPQRFVLKKRVKNETMKTIPITLKEVFEDKNIKNMVQRPAKENVGVTEMVMKFRFSQK
jgi:hypothetical protein